MRVILQEKIANLGTVGDSVTVKPGYARNFLIPGGKAVMATPDNIAAFELRRADLEKVAADLLAKAEARAAKLKDLVVTIEVQASEEGKLFGSVAPRDIAEAVVKAGQELEKSEVSMPEGPLRMVGDYDIELHFESDVVTTIKVSVVAEA